MEKRTLQGFKDLYCKYFYLEKAEVLDMIIALAVSAKAPTDGIWMMIVGAPSGGKTEMLNTIFDVTHNHVISNLTANTFLSSMKGAAGSENSLLHRIGPRGLLTFKDYTSLMSQRSEVREEILGQMREIYDGFLKKESGNGNQQVWKGKLNVLIAVTDAIYTSEGNSAAMGRRVLMYELPVMDDENRVKMTRAAMKNRVSIEAIREELRIYGKELVDQLIKELPPPEKMIPISDDELESIIELGNFITRARTGVERDYRGTLTFVNEPELPMRTCGQLSNLAQYIMYCRGDEHLAQETQEFIFKVAIDSIPKQRRQAIYLLSKYRELTSKGAATKIGMPTETMRMALEELNVQGICERYIKNEGASDFWKIKDKCRLVMEKYAGIGYEDEELTDDDESVGAYSIPSFMSSAMGIAKGYSDDPGEARIQKQVEKEKNDAFVNDLMKTGHEYTKENRIKELQGLLMRGKNPLNHVLEAQLDEKYTTELEELLK
jgi:hypothetical protein